MPVGFTQKMLDPLKADRVRIADALEAQHDDPYSVRNGPLPQRVEIAVEFGSGAEE